MSLWLSCLDHFALNNVDAPGCGASVSQGRKGQNQESFHPGVELYPKVSSPKVPTSHHINKVNKFKTLNRVLIK